MRVRVRVKVRVRVRVRVRMRVRVRVGESESESEAGPANAEYLRLVPTSTAGTNSWFGTTWSRQPRLRLCVDVAPTYTSSLTRNT